METVVQSRLNEGHEPRCLSCSAGTTPVFGLTSSTGPTPRRSGWRTSVSRCRIGSTGQEVLNNALH